MLHQCTVAMATVKHHCRPVGYLKSSVSRKLGRGNKHLVVSIPNDSNTDEAVQAVQATFKMAQNCFANQLITGVRFRDSQDHVQQAFSWILRKIKGDAEAAPAARSLEWEKDEEDNDFVELELDFAPPGEKYVVKNNDVGCVVKAQAWALVCPPRQGAHH